MLSPAKTIMNARCGSEPAGRPSPNPSMRTAISSPRASSTTTARGPGRAQALIRPMQTYTSGKERPSSDPSRRSAAPNAATTRSVPSSTSTSELASIASARFRARTPRRSTRAPPATAAYGSGSGLAASRTTRAPKESAAANGATIRAARRIQSTRSTSGVMRGSLGLSEASERGPVLGVTKGGAEMCGSVRLSNEWGTASPRFQALRRVLPSPDGCLADSPAPGYRPSRAPRLRSDGPEARYAGRLL